ncbi:MAG: aminotransferase class V-fold PLP-dependent enzyme [Conexivisphaera sp.]
MIVDVNGLRVDFPLLSSGVVYLDNAATSLKPRAVVEAMREYYEEYTENVHRGMGRLAQRATDEYEGARETVASLIGAKPDELVFTSGATASANLVAQGLSWREGDEIVVTRMEHHSNMLPWVRASRMHGLRLRFVELDEEGRLDFRSLEGALGPRTRLLAITQASNVTGVVNDVESAARMAHDAGALVLVDGAQSVPHMPVDVRRMGADFLAFSAHKMLGPTGIGGLYVSEGARGEISPPWLGGGIVSDVTGEEYSLLEFPHDMEPGTPNIAGAIGFGAAVRYLKRLGMDAVLDHESRLTEVALRALRDVDGLRLLGPWRSDRRLGIFSFAIRDHSVDEVAALLSEMSGIEVRSGYHCAQPLHTRYGFRGTTRASVYVYNTEDELRLLAESLGRISAILGRRGPGRATTDAPAHIGGSKD